MKGCRGRQWGGQYIWCTLQSWPDAELFKGTGCFPGEGVTVVWKQHWEGRRKRLCPALSPVGQGRERKMTRRACVWAWWWQHLEKGWMIQDFAITWPETSASKWEVFVGSRVGVILRRSRRCTDLHVDKSLGHEEWPWTCGHQEKQCRKAWWDRFWCFLRISSIFSSN